MYAMYAGSACSKMLTVGFFNYSGVKNKISVNGNLVISTYLSEFLVHIIYEPGP